MFLFSCNKREANDVGSKLLKGSQSGVHSFVETGGDCSLVGIHTAQAVSGIADHVLDGHVVAEHAPRESTQLHNHFAVVEADRHVIVQTRLRRGIFQQPASLEMEIGPRLDLAVEELINAHQHLVDVRG